MKSDSTEAADIWHMSTLIRDLTGRVRELLKEPIFTSALNLMTNGGFTAVLGFLFIMVITQMFPPSDVGLYSAIISAAGLLALFSRFGFDIGLIRFLPSSKDPNDFVGTCQSTALVGSMALSVIFLAGLPIWAPSLEFITDDLAFTIIFIAITMTTAVLYIQHNYYIVMRLTRQLIVRDVLRDVIKIASVILLAPLGLCGIMGASVAALIASFLLANMFLRRTVPGYRPRLSIRRDIARSLAKYSTNNYIAGMIGSAPYLILPVLVVNLQGAEQGAYFFVAWSVAMVIFIAIDAISTSFFAAGSRSTEEMKHIALRSLKIAYLILAPILVIILLFAPDLLSLFGAGYSENSSNLLMLLSICTIPMAFNDLYANSKRIKNEMRPLILYNLAIATGTLGLGTFLMGRMGIIGVGFGFLLTEVFLTLAISRRWRPWS